MFENYGCVTNAEVLTSERSEFNSDSATYYVYDFGQVTAFSRMPDIGS